MRCLGASLAAFGAALLLTPVASGAQPAREALVIGNGTYSSLPPISGCLQSSHAVSAALQRLGYHVVEREDVSSGGADAAIGEFAQALASAAGASAVIYSCGYATAFSNRPFLLPVSANISRPADILTQGILVKTLLDVITGSTGGSLIAVDAVPTPDAPSTLHFDALIQAGLPGNLGVIVATQPRPPETPTPLASALVSGLQNGGPVQTNALLAGLQQQLGTNSTLTLSVVHPPAASGYLIGAPAPPPAPAPVSPATPAIPAAPETTASFPADEQMTDSDRRRVQTALVRLGYYDGKIDGIFGPDSRAAIRRYQHELGADMTGRLTAAQTSRLISGH